MQRSAELRERRKIERQKQGIPEGNPFRPEEIPPPVPPATDPASDMRRLMEALGLPVEDEPVIREEAPELPPPLPEPPLRPRPPQKPAAPQRAAKSHAYNLPPSSLPLSRLAQSLRDKTQVRQAIILREVLGPPKALNL